MNRQWCHWTVGSLLGFTAEADTEADGGSAREWLFTTLAIDGSAVLVMVTVPFSHGAPL